MTKRWIKRIYAVEFLHYNVYNKIKQYWAKIVRVLCNMTKKMSARHVQNPINGFLCGVAKKTMR